MRNRRQGICLVALAFLCWCLVTGEARADIQLGTGTPVKVALDQDVSSKWVKPGDLVPIHLAEPIEMGGVVVVAEGVKGSARVKSVESAGKPGKPGRVEIELLQLDPGGTLQTYEDKPIMLTSTDTVTAKGKGKKTLSWLFIFGLFIKGGEGIIPADQVLEGQIAEDVIVLME